MRFLVDEALQSRVAVALGESGHDATHVVAPGLSGSTDGAVLRLAVAERRVLVTLDTDFGTLLAMTGASEPSVVLLRGLADDTQSRVAAMLSVLAEVEADLEAGAVVVIEEDRYRVRSLPIE